MRLGPCLLWSGKTLSPKASRAYGYLRINGKVVLAHRYVFFLAHGRWPRGVVRHRCDTPRCFRLGHLREGSQQQNVLDAVKRGSWPVGERSKVSKLSNADVVDMRARRAAGAGVAELGTLFGVNNGTVSRICAGRSRRHG